MFEISVQKNIKDYKGKAFFGFTWRQVISIGLALLTSVPLYWYCKSFVPETILGYAVMGIAVLFFGVGFYQKDGLPLEQYAFYVYESVFKMPRHRYYASPSLEEQLIEELYQQKYKRLQEINNILDGKKKK